MLLMPYRRSQRIHVAYKAYPICEREHHLNHEVADAKGVIVKPDAINKCYFIHTVTSHSVRRENVSTGIAIKNPNFM